MIDNAEAYAQRLAIDSAIADSNFGYTNWQLHNAFKMVQNPEGWKMPIDAIIDDEDMDVVAAAIDYYAGGGAEFYEADIMDQANVIAPGYYNTIGA